MLIFGTSGLRGLVTDMTDQECYINTLGFLNYLKNSNQVQSGSVVSIAGDLRTSTDRIMTACAKAAVDAGCLVENADKIPSPALMAYAMPKKQASIMVTGSHIPDDRNGIKFNKADGEVLKNDETGILKEVAQVREKIEDDQSEQSIFDNNGMFKNVLTSIFPDAIATAKDNYVQRYLLAFNGLSLQNKKIVVDQHSAVGRDMLVEIIEKLGAQAIPDGRTDYFVPKDTENITEDTKANFLQLAKKHEPFAIVSTDGDSDRPFVVGSDGTFYRGDILGAVVAKYLKANICAVPVSANDAIDNFLEENNIKRVITRIGSPFVIAAMNQAKEQGTKKVIGWEVNGGVLLGSDYKINNNTLTALPTRDAILPILAALFAALEAGSVEELFKPLTNRYTQAGLIDEFPAAISKALVAAIRPDDEHIFELLFDNDMVTIIKEDGSQVTENINQQTFESVDLFWKNKFTIMQTQHKRSGLEQFYFKSSDGFNRIKSMNFVDGIRIGFENQNVAHIRPSGNAPQLRIYAVADSQERADQIVEMGIKPDGILRQMEKDINKYSN